MICSPYYPPQYATKRPSRQDPYCSPFARPEWIYKCKMSTPTGPEASGVVSNMRGFSMRKQIHERDRPPVPRPSGWTVTHKDGPRLSHPCFGKPSLPLPTPNLCGASAQIPNSRGCGPSSWPCRLRWTHWPLGFPIRSASRGGWGMPPTWPFFGQN